MYCLICRRLFPTGKHFRGGCNLALITSRHKKKMLLPANGSEKCTAGYCNHNNVFRSSETENEMPDKHMLFLIKNDLVLSGPHCLQGCSAKAERRGDPAPLGCSAVSHPSLTAASPWPSPPCASYPMLQNRADVFLSLPSLRKLLSSPRPSTRPNSVLNALSGYLGLRSFGQN